MASWYYYDSSRESLKTCWIQTLKIDSKNFVLANGRDESIKVLAFPGNIKVEFLPTKVANALPNLEGFSAYACSIREIFKENFVGLSNLELLDLHYNQIETVRSGTFEGLSSLRAVHLCKLDFEMDNNLYCVTTIASFI
jgi:hypothetical protein